MAKRCECGRDRADLPRACFSLGARTSRLNDSGMEDLVSHSKQSARFSDLVSP